MRIRHIRNLYIMNLNTRRLRVSLSGFLFSTLVVLSGPKAEAQTYYYIDQIVVTPAAPTTADAITITVNGALSSTASYIMNTGFNVVGNTVQLNVNAGTQGIGLDVLVPHSESFSIGQLAAGTYTISISGSAMLDSAPGPEHQFTVSGGTPTDCDSLDIISVTWGVLSTDRIVVTAANASSDLFDYPGFVLLELDGDTIAKEAVNFFGIGTNPQEHLLDVVDGAEIDGNTLDARLHLWSNSYSEFECEFDGTWELCPSVECWMSSPFVVNMGNAIVGADIPYSIENSDGLTMATGTFELTQNQQSDYEPGICLPPDAYTLVLEQITPVGGQLYYGITADMMHFQQVQECYLQGSAVNILPFSVFAACIDSDNAVPATSSGTTIEIRQDENGLLVVAPSGSRIGAYQLLDLEGRMVGEGNLNSDRGQIRLSGLAHGVYIFRGAWSRSVRFVR